MATNRRLVFSNGYIYHIFNRGIDRRSVFTGFREYLRAQELIEFYKHLETPVRYSKFLQLSKSLRDDVLREINKSETQVDILAYCLMPNHFHFMLQQKVDKGVSTFIANFTNAYTRYFNTKHERIGPMFEGLLTNQTSTIISGLRIMNISPPQKTAPFLRGIWLCQCLNLQNITRNLFLIKLNMVRNSR